MHKKGSELVEKTILYKWFNPNSSSNHCGSSTYARKDGGGGSDI
jgi:hypothetical protein